MLPKLEIISGLEKIQGSLRSKLQSAQTENEEMRATVGQEDNSLAKVVEEKQMVEKQLEKVTLEMASVQNVVSEMTRTFKQQVQVKDQELRKCQEENVSLSGVKGQMNLYLGRNSLVFSCEGNSKTSRTVSESASLSVLMF